MRVSPNEKKRGNGIHVSQVTDEGERKQCFLESKMDGKWGENGFSQENEVNAYVLLDR